MLNEMSINAFGIFVSPYGPFEGSFYKIAFGQRPIREERKSSFLLLMKAKKYHKGVNILYNVSGIFRPSCNLDMQFSGLVHNPHRFCLSHVNNY